jgi:hypothetical protein
MSTYIRQEVRTIDWMKSLQIEKTQIVSSIHRFVYKIVYFFYTQGHYIQVWFRVDVIKEFSCPCHITIRNI